MDISVTDVSSTSPRVRFSSESESNSVSAQRNSKFRQHHRARLQRDSGPLCDSETQKEHLKLFQENIRKQSRTTNVEEEKKRNIDYDESVLGMVNSN